MLTENERLVHTIADQKQALGSARRAAQRIERLTLDIQALLSDERIDRVRRDEIMRERTEMILSALEHGF